MNDHDTLEMALRGAKDCAAHLDEDDDLRPFARALVRALKRRMPETRSGGGPRPNPPPPGPD